MDRQAHRQWHTPLPRQARIELPHGLYNPESGPHRPLRIILVGQGVAKIDQQSIAEILRDMALKTLDHCRAGRLISAHHLAQLFRVKTRRQCRRVDQVTKQHRQLAPFGLWRHTPGRCWANRHGLVCRRVWRLFRLEGRRCRPLRQRRDIPGPDQHFASLVAGQALGLDDFGLEVLQVGVVEVKAPLQGAIRHSPLTLEQIEHLG